MAHRAVPLSFLLMALNILAVGCTEAATLCDPGGTQVCRCGDDWGHTTCDDEGASWGGCVCPSGAGAGALPGTIDASGSSDLDAIDEQGPETVCVPNCAGKECGDDGCGGTCGVCTSGATCDDGACVGPTVDLECNEDNTPSIQECPEGLTYEGCCMGSVLFYCEDDEVMCSDCGTDGFTCGWSVEYHYYACKAEWEMEDPSGVHPIECTFGSCVSSCTGKECGDDGCGGSCGTCAAQETCKAGVCVTDQAIGGECQSDDDCDSGFCYLVSGGASFCTKPCFELNDCPDPYECMPTILGDGDTAYLCMPPSCAPLPTPEGAVAVVHEITLHTDGYPGSGLDVDEDPATCAPSMSCSGGIDNASGPLSDIVSSFVDLEQEVANALYEGSLVYLVELNGWDPGEAPFEAVLFSGAMDPTTGCAPASSGMCGFYVDDSQHDDNGCAKYTLRECHEAQGTVTCGGPGYVASAPFFPYFLDATVGMPGVGSTSPLLLHDAVIQLELGSGAGSSDIITGILGGAVKLSVVQDNLYQSSSCTIGPCPGDNCDINTCTIEMGGMSLPLSVLMNLLSNALEVDMDLNGDGALVWEDDGVSIGYALSFGPASILGVAE